MERKLRIQKRVKGKVRKRLYPSVLKEIRRAVKAEAQEHGVSMSFVVSVHLARAYGIKSQELYSEAFKATMRKVLRLVGGSAR